MRYLLILICLIPFHLNAQFIINNDNDTVIIVSDRDTTGCICNLKKKDIKQINDTIATFQSEVLRACCYHCLAIHYYINGNYEKSIANHENALDVRINHQKGYIWKSHYAMALAYDKLYMYHKAGDYYQESFNHLKDVRRNKDSVEILRMFALNRNNVGEIKQAKFLAERATKVRAKARKLSDAYNTLSIVLSDYPNDTTIHKRALICVDTAITLYGKPMKSKEFRALARRYNNKAAILSQLGRYDDAIAIYEKSQKIRPESDIIGRAQVINNIGVALRKQGKYEQAISKIKKSLKLKETYHKKTTYHRDYVANYENLGIIYTKMGNYDEALLNFQLAIDNLKDNPKSDSPYIYNKLILLRVLDLKAQAAMYNGNIELAYRIYVNIDNWITEFYKDLSTDESKLTWINRAHEIYANAIEVAFVKNENEEAFEYAEKAHAVLLWQRLSRQALINSLSVPDKELIEELSIKINRANLQYLNGIKEALDSLRLFENTLKKVEKKYDIYAESNATTVQKIQTKIVDARTAFIEYYLTDHCLYIFTITEDSFKVYQKDATGLTDDISSFIENIKSRGMNVPNYNVLANSLYKQLIPSDLQLKNNIEHLVIVPDGVIGTLPFSALLTENTTGVPNGNTPFLVKKYSTNYLYSAGSYLQLQDKSANQPHCFGGIAPVEYEVEISDESQNAEKKKWDKLENAGEELDEIKSLHWKSERKILKHEEATKAAFIEMLAEGRRTILVSTHARYKRNKGEIVFRKSVLSQDEIDLLKINTHRLILSACETGVGKENKGEGILSLGWHFAYKGVPSITMTHWEIPDESSKELMVSYNKNLNDIPADQALQKAQLDYLKKTKADKSPFYWAAFFHTGNTD